MANILSTSSGAPLDIEEVDIYQVVLGRTALSTGNVFPFSSGTLSGTTTVTGTIIPEVQPNNSVRGKKLFVELNSSNLGAGPNTVIINGTTFSGTVTETLTFSLAGSQTSVQFWRTISSIAISVTATVGALPAGALQITESVPLNRVENAGNYAEIQSYDNGVFTFIQAGTSTSFDLQPGRYIVDYVIPSVIGIAERGPLVIGGDLNHTNFAQSIIESPQFFNDSLDDVRRGEVSSLLTHTSLHNLSLAPTATAATTALIDLDGKISSEIPNYVNFEGTHSTSIDSVNSNFGASVIVERPLRFSNASELIGPKTGTIEFFISPIHDTWRGDGQERQIFDITNRQELSISSTTAMSVVMPFKIRTVEKIYLSGDEEKQDLRSTYSLQRDGRTILLQSRLPKQRTALVVQYTPIQSSGDRMELWIDGYTDMYFQVTSGEFSAQIIRPVNWKRNTWHRVMCSWDLGNPDRNDRIRLFVDGVEDSIIMWGSGLVWGDGSIWGQGTTSVAPTLADLPPFEVFGEVTFGSNFAEERPYPFRLDNLRFSANVRAPVRVGIKDYDLAWNANTAAMYPVITDAYTKALFDFDMQGRETGSLANLLRKDTPSYAIEVQIDDGFGKITSNSKVRQALLNLYQRTKPSHMRLFASIKQEQ
jgi:hypothetical protein